MALPTQRVVPALRITNYQRSMAFYVDRLGFRIEWEHRFEPNFPVFMAVARDGMEIYLSEHSDRTCRRLHFVGSTLALLLMVYVIASANLWALLLVPIVGYGFAWVGHFFFEHNRPATFKYPLYSFIGYWVMYKEIITGRIRF